MMQNNQNVLNIDIGTACGMCIYQPEKSRLIATTFRMKYNSYPENARLLSTEIEKIVKLFKITKVNLELVSIKISSDKALANHWFLYGVILSALDKETIVTEKDPMTIRSRALRSKTSDKGITTGTKKFSTIYVNNIFGTNLNYDKDNDAVDSILVHLANEGNKDKGMCLTHCEVFTDIYKYATSYDKKIYRE